MGLERNTAPGVTDTGLVVRPLGGGGGTAGAAVEVVDTPSSVATRTSVAAAVADTLLLAANATRLGATVHNDSTANLFLALGTAAASTTSYTTIVAPGAYYELPIRFTGQIRGIWSVATGNARVTELTP